jgi:hypothetical protein
MGNGGCKVEQLHQRDHRDGCRRVGSGVRSGDGSRIRHLEGGKQSVLKVTAKVSGAKEEVMRGISISDRERNYWCDYWSELEGTMSDVSS